MPDSRDQALAFTARVGEREIQGCDLLHLDEDGPIDESTVMGARFERIAREARDAGSA
ncbi:hypothetical protein [Streptomyces sp. NBC_00459]|uniref:hypothetical protein n=1 Tax=Streptomyces sp. NBC_00459 TaxID=2975749 RepID=UPI003FA79137